MAESNVSEESEIEKTPESNNEFRYEDLMFWVNKGKDKSNKREFSVEDLERWSQIGRSKSKSKSRDKTIEEMKSPMI